jgi:hypothetical protein
MNFTWSTPSLPGGSRLALQREYNDRQEVSSSGGRLSAFRAPSGLLRLVELARDGVRQGSQAGLNDAVGNAHRGPGSDAVRRFNENTDIRAGAVFFRRVRNVRPGGREHEHLVVDQVHLLQFRALARQGAAER